MLYYTFAQLKAAAEHALGGAPDSRISKGLIVNRALNHLANAHQWSWLSVTTELGYTANQGGVELPADFGELVEIVGQVNKYLTVRRMTARDLSVARVNGIFDSSWLGYNVQAAPQTDPTAPPRYQLQVAPVPTATVAAALRVTYRRILATFPVADNVTTHDTHVPNIPAGMHDTLYALVRAFALSMEEDPATPEWGLASQLLARDVDKDSRVQQPILGPMAGCYVNDYEAEGLPWRPHSRILMPGD